MLYCVINIDEICVVVLMLVHQADLSCDLQRVNCITLFPFVLTSLFCCTAYGKLLVCHAHKSYEHLQLDVFSSSTMNRFHVNNSHTMMYIILKIHFLEKDQLYDKTIGRMQDPKH